MNSNHIDNEDEISLNDLATVLKRLFYSVIYVFNRIFQFYWKHKIIIMLLIIAGIVINAVEKSTKVPQYITSALVVQNFESVNYLYSAIDNINKNIGETTGKTILKEVFGDDFERVLEIEVTPVNDFYNFDDVNASNKEIFETFSKSSDVSNNIKTYEESIFFKYHRIDLLIKDSKKTDVLVNNLFKYLNRNEHFSEYAKAFLKHADRSIKENNHSIASIDSLINSYIIQNKLSSSNLNISNNSDLYKLYEQKERFVNNNLYYETRKVDFEKVIKPVSIEYNKPVKKIVPYWLMYPFILVMLYSMIFLTKYLFRKSEVYIEK